MTAPSSLNAGPIRMSSMARPAPFGSPPKWSARTSGTGVARVYPDGIEIA